MLVSSYINRRIFKPTSKKPNTLDFLWPVVPTSGQDVIDPEDLARQHLESIMNKESWKGLFWGIVVLYYCSCSWCRNHLWPLDLNTDSAEHLVHTADPTYGFLHLQKMISKMLATWPLPNSKSHSVPLFGEVPGSTHGQLSNLFFNIADG